MRLRTALAAVLLLAPGEPAVAQNVVSDLPLAGGGKERVAFASPADPAAMLVMFAGGDGTVEIADSGTIYRPHLLTMRTRSGSASMTRTLAGGLIGVFDPSSRSALASV
jgi:hypothetical protein